MITKSDMTLSIIDYTQVWFNTNWSQSWLGSPWVKASERQVNRVVTYASRGDNLIRVTLLLQSGCVD